MIYKIGNYVYLSVLSLEVIVVYNICNYVIRFPHGNIGGKENEGLEGVRIMVLVCKLMVVINV